MKKNRIKNLVLISALFFAVAAIAQQEAPNKMMDTSLDNPGKEWCYLQKGTTVVGFPFMSDVTQITYDGAIFTKYAEVSFFYGETLKPVCVRQKTWKEGYIPVIQYDWNEGNLSYKMEIFSARLSGVSDNELNYARVIITNNGKVNQKSHFATAIRFSGGDYRFDPKFKFSSKTIFSIRQNQVFRDSTLIFSFPQPSKIEAVRNNTYNKPFAAADFNIQPETPTCIASYDRDLQPGIAVKLIFKMPRVPVRENSSLITAIQSADYQSDINNTITYWNNFVNNGHSISIPEARVNNAIKASMTHLALATRTRDNTVFMTDGLPYPNPFLTSFIHHQLAFDFFGHSDLVTQSILPYTYKMQGDDGLFYDASVLHEVRLGVAEGHMLELLCSHYFLTRDQQFAQEVYPKIKKAILWMEQNIKADEYHLMPPAYPYDNEMINGHYTRDNLFALAGLRSAIRMAKELNKTEDVKNWNEFHQFYKESLMKALTATFQSKGYISPGLYNYDIGQKARKGFDDWQTNQEWENMMLLQPFEILEPGNAMADSTLNRIRRERIREGVMTYRIYLHQYITVNMMEQEMARDNQKQTLIDLYNVLLHLGSTYEGFENLVKPWQDRSVNPECPSPHAWASSKLAIFMRNMLVAERGGEGGLNESERSIHLYSLISPEWCKPGKEIKIANIATEFGAISSGLKFTNNGAEISMAGNFNRKLASIVVHIPYFVKLNSFTSDATKAEQGENCIIFSSDVKKISLKWSIDKSKIQGDFQTLLMKYRGESTLSVVDKKEKIEAHQPLLLPSEKKLNAGELLSFELVKKAFVHEYNRKARQFVEKGGKLEKF